MKKLIALVTLIFFASFKFPGYDPDYVTFTSPSYEGLTFQIIKMDRSDNHVKAKYFAVKDVDGKSVPDRYKGWNKSKNIIAVCSGTYMDRCGGSDSKPVSITIDQGNIVNKTTAPMDGIVAVFSSGEIVVGNIKMGELKIGNKNYNLQQPLEQELFFNWAQNNKATVFQTHLLIYKDNLTIYEKSSPTARERRFLAGCTDENGDKYDYIINIPNEISLIDGAKNTKRFLKQTMKSIDYLINLDTGCQDYFEAFHSNGEKHNDYQGKSNVNSTINLLSFYFE